ncbi:hypothetical protein [Candidatus Symbiopectobacterium endolongispinus]|uniref:hypothetical protein n=1 Tax=Candidatus Symbiopectobacterium endolongispinus TaxID=2812664 RepID=UPI00207A0217|nr:hypothetical protein [Candidatus Symbiopectobacterium endolongispinus]MBT9428911.1 hypothetical protein [Candidatus Symbiopectobacterium endolongispinus]
MLNTDERLYYAGAGETLKTLLLHVYQGEALKGSRNDESTEQVFANRAKQIAVSVRDAYLTLLHVPLPQRGGDFDLALSQKIAKNLKYLLADEINGKGQAG